MLQIKVRYYHRLRDMISKQDEVLYVDPGATAADLLTRVIASHPAVAQMRGSILFARNSAYISEEDRLRDGDIVDLMPPVSGG